jgi:hypothetical protein
MIEDALPGALRAAGIDPWDADTAETIARAYLHLAQGLPSKDLSLAGEWFRRTLALCPARQRVAATLRQIGAQDASGATGAAPGE